MKPEDILQIHVVNYLELQYPDAMFESNPMSGMKLTIGMATKAKRMGHRKGWPDVKIFEQRMGFSGLFLELKVVDPYRKDATLKKDKHLEEQAEIHRRLVDRGYAAMFVTGFEEAKAKIDWYLREIKNGSGDAKIA